MKITQAYILLAKLRCLTLVGQNFEGELEWIGSTTDWDKVDHEAERILRDWDLAKI